jgi:gluconolactonase
MRILAGLLALSLIGCGDDGGGTGPDAAGGVDAEPGIDADPTVDPLDGIGQVMLVGGGMQFVEGPQWHEVDGLLFFSDIPADTIYQVDGDTITEFRSPSGNSNGLALDPDRNLLAAEHGTRRVSRDTATVVDEYEGLRLNSPNDVIARSDGTIYFTDPPYGISDADRELPFMGVFRVPIGGGALVAEWEGPLAARPNGIALSPDESILYVADTADGMLRAWDVATDGSLSNERVVTADVPGADGMAVDDVGNLFVTTSTGIRVFAPDGTMWGTITVPEQPANCAFGGDDRRTLFITARTSLYRVDLAAPGLTTH